MPSSFTSVPTRTQSRAARIVQSLLDGYQGDIEIRLWDGTSLHFGDSTVRTTLVFRDPNPLTRTIILRDPLQLIEGYIRGYIDIEGDLYAALEIRHFLSSVKLTWHATASLLTNVLAQRNPPLTTTSESRLQSRSVRRQFLGRNTKDDNRDAIAFHYDVSNDFYRLWLDESMVYSCAYFENPGDTLEHAQRNKLDLICRKLRLKQGEKLLDIGCGWGALIIWAARHYGVTARGVTISRRQYEFVRHKIAEEKLEHMVSVELQDYRDLEGELRYDKIVSVGMFEHVGLKNLSLYFQTAHRLLKPGGLFLNHGITHDQEGWRKTLSTRFINRYVFPDGELDTVSNVQKAMERCGFEIHDVEALRPHYALTLRHWVKRLEKNRTEALAYVPENVYRVWRLYMAASALHFEDGDIGVYQILTSRRTKGLSVIPLTRCDLYEQFRRDPRNTDLPMSTQTANRPHEQSDTFRAPQGN
jgi:cyclopropane-fatty-acyl-phospholipid synthase